jgi:nitroimidazol reductase NimA-like FMN-containing flavoprotein (pyridoxamine 5'-phosphate oxidase superfamily)
MSGNIREMTTEECRALLAPGGVGRVALATARGISIVPVNFTVHQENAIVFRTAPYSELGTYGRGVEAAFETDQLDYTSRKGWSVVAHGQLMLVDDPDEVYDIRQAADPWPWAAGQRSLYMKLTWSEISGRRIEDPAVSEPTPGGRRVR